MLRYYIRVISETWTGLIPSLCGRCSIWTYIYPTAPLTPEAHLSAPRVVAVDSGGVMLNVVQINRCLDSFVDMVIPSSSICKDKFVQKAF